MPLDWRLERPDFSNQDRYEEDGWNKIGAYDLPYVNNKMGAPAAVGSLNPSEILLRIHEYGNENLKLFAATFDFFLQGIVFEEWMKIPKNSLPGSHGIAMFSDNRWIVKQLDEYAESNYATKEVSGKLIVEKVRVLFRKNFLSRTDGRVTARLEVNREI